jgi:tetratricopeptide (TPR) repeat protein
MQGGGQLLALTPQPPPPPVVEKDADDPIPIEARADVDERLFLVRALETLYERWPVPEGNPAEFDRAIDELRRDAHRHSEYVRQRDLAPELAVRFDDLAGLLDRYQEAAARIGRITRQGAAAIDKQRTDDMAKASFNGGFEAGTALAAGAPGGQAFAIWALLTSASYLLENNGKAEQVNEASREAIERIVREYESAHSRVFARAQTLATALGEKYGWKPGEWGLDASLDQARHVLEVIERQDLKELARLLDIARNRRPRDPIALVASTLCLLRAKGEAAITKDDVQRAIDQCVHAAGLVPRGSFYDTYRSDIIGLAGLLATGAVEKEVATRGWVAAPVQSASRAVKIWRTYLALDPVDSTGDAREQLAWALAGAGRFDDALALLRQIVDLKQSDVGYAYNSACLLSIKGRTGEALDWLKQAIKNGWADIAHAKSDPDLARVRSERAARFNDLITVKFDWSIDWGLISDDIVLTNRSAFPLTNIAASVKVTSSRHADWVDTLKAPGLAPGQTHRWNTRISSRGENTKAWMSLSADQSR